MFAAPFEYHRPATVDEAIKLLHDVKGARLLAGGHSLLPAMKLRLASPAALVDISRIKELTGIRLSGGGVQIGALTTHSDVAGSEDIRKSFPVLAETAGSIGDMQVRNRGTMGGSVAHADPGADYPTVLLMLDATFTAVGWNGHRDIPARDFFVDLFTTSLKPGELLTTIAIPSSSSGGRAVYLKHRHPASAFAVVGVAVRLDVKGGKCEDVRIAIGGAAASPVRATAAEKSLKGQEPTEANCARAAGMVEQSIPTALSDTYASAQYRQHLATVMTRRALMRAAAQ